MTDPNRDPNRNRTPQTSLDAYESILDSGEDVVLRRRVAAALAVEPRTTPELVREAFPDRSANAIRPRVSELLRMGCVRRDGTRPTKSGNDAYVHHLTPLGRQYARGEVDPEPEPSLADLRRRVVDIAREVVRGGADTDVLAIAVERHDALETRMYPDMETDDE